MNAAVSIDSIKARIANANASSSALNTQRQVNIGKRATLETQLERLFAEYASKYGVQLTAETVESELNRVATLKAEEVSKIEEMISLITAGEYDKARALAGEIVVEEAKETASVVEETKNVEVTATHVETPVPPVVETPVQPVNETPVTPIQTPAVETPTVPVAPVAPTIPSSPTAPSAPVIPSAPVMPSAPVSATPQFTEPVVPQPTAPVDPFGLNNGLGGALAGFQPANPSAPISGLENVKPVTQNTSPTSFQSILGGTAFDISKK